MWRHFQRQIEIEEFGNSTEIQRCEFGFNRPDFVSRSLNLLASEYLDEDEGNGKLGLAYCQEFS